MNSKNKIKYRADVDGLRALAVVPVVLYHVGFGLPGGFAGVDVFFVISGYLITSILLKELRHGEFSIVRFYERRARRLFPALFFMLVVTTAVASIWLLPEDLVSYAKSVIATLFFLSNIFFYTEVSYFNEMAQLKPLLHTWSLGVEEQFYVVVPLVLMVFWRFFPQWVIRLSIVIGVLISFSLGLWLAGHHAGFYLPFSRAWELGVGMILALWGTRVGSRVLANILGLLGIALLMLTFTLMSSSTPWPGFAALAPCFGAAAVILAGTQPQSVVTRMLSMPHVVGLGKISYSLYLWHWPVVVFASYGRFDPFTGSEKVLLVVSSVLLALLSWWIIEQPVRHKRFLANRSSVAVGGAFATVIVVVLAASLIRFEGFPVRVSEELAARWQVQRVEDPTRACHGITSNRAATGDVCTRGAEGAKPSFVLVGDSHAKALSPGVFAAGANLGLSGFQFTGPGFVPTPERYRIGSVVGREVDDDRVDAFLQFLRDRPDIEFVLITGWWHRYATGVSYREQTAVWSDGDCMAMSVQQCNASSLERSLMRLAENLKDRTIILLDDVAVGWNLHPQSHFRAAFSGQAGRAPELSLDVARAQFLAYAPLLQNVAEEMPNVLFQPVVLDGLCGDVCSAIDDEGMLIYSDGDHLTQHGAGLLVDDLQRILQAFRVEPTT